MITALEVIGGLLALGIPTYLIGCFVVAVINTALTDGIARGLNL